MPPTLYALFYRQPLRFDSTLKVVVNLAFHTFPAAHAIHASPHLWVVVVVTRPAGTPVGARPRVLGLFEQDPPKMVDRGPCLGLVVGGRRWFWSSAKGGMKGGSWHSTPGTVARECRLPFSCFSCLGLVALFVLCALVPYVCDGRFSKLVIMGIGDWFGFTRSGGCQIG